MSGNFDGSNKMPLCSKQTRNTGLILLCYKQPRLAEQNEHCQLYFFFMFLKLHNLIQKCPVGASCAYKAMFRKQRFPFNQNRVLSKERQRETTYPPMLIKPCLQKEQFQASDSPSSCQLTLKRTHSERVAIELVNMSSQTVLYSQ